MANELVQELTRELKENILQRWYPLVVDRECGGYFTNVSYEWKLEPEQEKMIVSQARHIWTTSKAAAFFPDRPFNEGIARHGFRFLKTVMWDGQYGGFYQIRDRKGGPTPVRGWRDEKRTYGNAFGVFSLAALYRLTGDPEVLDFAKEGFEWIETHAFDPVYKGYFQFILREGTPFDTSSSYKSIASDVNELGYKDQNASIHLLEAYTELYQVWNDPALRDKLNGLLTLIRDTQVHPRGYLQLFFQPDWTPVSFRDATEEVRKANYGLDHVSFGHDYETGFLMLEASHALGLKGDTRTLSVAKRMLDHAIANGWDAEVGGFYDGGYYFKGSDQSTIIAPTKNWWAQAEALNALLLFSRIFPKERYYSFFLKQLDYVRRYIIDHENGDWFEGGIDKEPQLKTGPKSQMWKCTYHTGRALMNCITMLDDGTAKEMGDGFADKKKEWEGFIGHWKETARRLPA